MTPDQNIDEKSFNAWLEARPKASQKADASILAYRAACRVMPIFGQSLDSWTGKQAVTTLPFLRAVLTMGVGVREPTGGNVLLHAENDVDFARAVAEYAADSRQASDVNAAYAATYAATTAVNAIRGKMRSVLGNAYSAARYASVTEHSRMWKAVQEDARIIQSGGNLLATRLWPGRDPDWFRQFDHEMRDAWRRDNLSEWDFWTRWWDGVLSGNQLVWSLQEAVALIPDEVWGQGPGAVARLIREIEGANRVRGGQDLNQELQLLRASAFGAIAKAKQAYLKHREALPPTFDAVLSYITLEIERLQPRNHRDDGEAAEARRQIGVLVTLFQAVSAMKELVPVADEMPQRKAEEAEKLSRLFVRTFKEWPRGNADELVDSTCRAALVGGATVMLPMIGVTVPYAFAAGLVLFGGKKMAEAVKVARDATKP